ncbi:MAG: hypothetical protein MPJ50_12705 [Pirellulales bacterium]|nr:hypothetical protein [Pirellulales bacterium]
MSLSPSEQSSGIDLARYHGWHGTLRNRWAGCLAMVRVSLLQVIRRKLYWLVLALGFSMFLIYWSLIYALAQLNLPEFSEQILSRFQFNVSPTPGVESGYVQFMNQQSVVVMLLLALSGSQLVGADFRLRSLTFYLSRRIDRGQYIVGKLLAVSTLISALTVLPALLLFFEYGAFTTGREYWLANWQVIPAVLGYGAVMCFTLSLMLTTISAYLQKMAPIAITWSCLFVLLKTIAVKMARETGNSHWLLLDLWSNILFTGRMFFGVFPERNDGLVVGMNHAIAACSVLVIVCTICTFLLVRRVRAVDVVE